MKRTKLLTLFAAAAMMLGVQKANADVIYTALNGSNWNHSSESPRALFDGKSDTKWGNALGENSTNWVVFKTSSPILPTKYKLRIAKDTSSFTGRNWKNWKIYGGNFLTDADATKDASGWVEIDNKADQSLSTTGLDEVELTLTSPGSNHYFYYFKIEVSALVTTGQYGQMDEFWFSSYTEGDFAYAVHSASNPNGGEGARRLFDGHGNTKWGRSTGPSNPSWVIFKTSKAINATSYTLTEANDTPKNSGRNWKKWKIYGANFYSENIIAQDAKEWVHVGGAFEFGAVEAGMGNVAIAAVDERSALFRSDWRSPADERLMASAGIRFEVLKPWSGNRLAGCGEDCGLGEQGGVRIAKTANFHTVRGTGIEVREGVGVGRGGVISRGGAVQINGIVSGAAVPGHRGACLSNGVNRHIGGRETVGALHQNFETRSFVCAIFTGGELHGHRTAVSHAYVLLTGIAA